MTTRLNRTLATLAVPALSLSLLAAPAHADAPKVTRADFPSNAQVAKVFPDLKKAKAEGDKVGWTAALTSCETSRVFRTKRDRQYGWATDTSKHVVLIQVSEFSKVSTAKKVIKGVRIGNKCDVVEADGGYVARTVKAPKLGTERAGTRIKSGAADEKAEFVSFAFRKKNRVIEVQVVSLGKANLKQARRIAKIAYKAGL